jgi:hypothetical protein
VNDFVSIEDRGFWDCDQTRPRKRDDSQSLFCSPTIETVVSEVHGRNHQQRYIEATVVLDCILEMRGRDTGGRQNLVCLTNIG